MGCTLYELASLKPLAGNGSEWHRLRDNPAPLEKYSKDFCRLIFAMLDENPNTRPTCQDILQEQIVSPSQSISMLKEANKRIAELENTSVHILILLFELKVCSRICFFFWGVGGNWSQKHVHVQFL